jgi:hypothetical protein
VLGGKHADYFSPPENTGWLGDAETAVDHDRRILLATDTTKPDPRLCSDCKALRERARVAGLERLVHS